MVPYPFEIKYVNLKDTSYNMVPYPFEIKYVNLKDTSYNQIPFIRFRKHTKYIGFMSNLNLEIFSV